MMDNDEDVDMEEEEGSDEEAPRGESSAPVHHPSTLAMHSALRGDRIRADGKQVRFATVMTKKMMEARHGNRSMTPEEKRKEAETLKQMYLGKYGITDGKTGERRFPDITKKEDLISLAQTHGYQIFHKKSESVSIDVMEKGGYMRYPKTKRDPRCTRVPIDRETHALMMETYRKDLGTWSCCQPLINIPVRTSVMALFLVDTALPVIMDSFDLINFYRVAFLILTAGSKMEI